MKGGCRSYFVNLGKTARSGGFLTAAVPQEIFDDAIFEAVECHHRQTAAGLQQLLCCNKPVFQFTEFAIDMDTDRLEGPGGRVLLVTGAISQRLSDHQRQLRRPGQRPRLDDRPGDPARTALLAITIDDIGNRLFIRFVEKVGGALAIAGHAHVERPVFLEREAALGLIKLHRRHADIERYTVNIFVDQHVCHFGIAGVVQVKLAIGAINHRLPSRNCVGILIECVDGRAGL